MRRFVRFCVFVLFCAVSAAGPARAEPMLGEAAPALAGKTLAGKDFDLAALKGKVTVVYFWATWAGACRYELPALEAVWRHYHGLGLEVLAIAGDRPRARGEVDQVMRFFTFPAAMLDAMAKNEFGNPALVPTTYVIDQKGVVQAIFTPMMQPLTEAALGQTVKALLEPPKAEAKPEEEKKSDEAKSDDKKTDDKKTDDKK